MTALARGRQIEFSGTDRFAIRRRLGSGGMGVVYEALDRDKNSTVAVKTLRRLDAQALYRLKNEFRALQGLEHPNLVGLGELVEDSGEWFFTMELIRGVDFLSYVRGDRADRSVGASATTAVAATEETMESPSIPPIRADFDEARLRDAFRQLAAGLVTLHAAGKVHRDVKPSNIMVTEHGRVVLLDFGLITGAEAEAQSTEAHAVGTAAYMAPEQAAARPVGPAADWYSTGAILYEALTGRPPFSGPALRVLQDKQFREAIPPVSLIPDVPLDLDDICVQLLRCNPDDRPAEDRILAAFGVESLPPQASATTDFTRSPPFVGRDSERKLLSDAFEQVRDGGAISVYVHGASGLGKSALVREFVDRSADEHGAVVLSGRCHERESVPFKALDELIDSLSRYMRRLRQTQAAALVPRNAALLARIFPVLDRVEVIGAAPRPRREHNDPRQTRRLVFSALRDLFWRLAERHPLILFIDDLQWADNDSFVLIDELIRPPDAPQMLVLFAARAGPAALSRARGVAGQAAPFPGVFRDIRLGPLSPDDGVALSRLLAERAGVPRDADTIAAEAGGHPLFIDELVRHAATVGPGARGKLRLDEAIWARVCQLPELAQRTLRAACLANTPLPQVLVRRAIRASPPAFARAVSGLRAANLVRGKGTRDSDIMEPYHNRVREAVVGHLEDAERFEIHSALATALLGSEFEVQRPELLVVHLEATGQARKAADRAAVAAERAAEALAFDHAVELYRKAVALLEPAGDVPSSLRSALGDALSMAGRRADAAEVYLACAEGATAAATLEFQRLAAESFIVSGHVDEGVEVLRKVLGSVGLPFPEKNWRAFLSAMFRRAWLRVRGLGFQERDATQTSAEELNRIDVCWTASASMGMIDTIRSVDYNTRHLARALRAGERQRVVRGLALEACVRCAMGVRHARQALDIVETLWPLAGDDAYLQGWVHGAESLARYHLGEFKRSREASNEAERLFSKCKMSSSYEQDTARLCNLWSRYYLGEISELAMRVPTLLQDAEERGDLYMAANMCTGPPNAAWLLRDDIETARAQADARISAWSRQSYHLQHYWAFVARHQILLYTGAGEEAWQSVNDGWTPLAKSLFLGIPMVGIEAHDLRARCALAAAVAGGDSTRLIASAERDARRVEKVPLPVASSLAVLVRASVAHLRGDRAGAMLLLADAAARCRANDMQLIAAAAQWQLGRLQGGDRGDELAAQAENWMHGEGIVAPERVSRMLAPGFASPSGTADKAG